MPRNPRFKRMASFQPMSLSQRDREMIRHVFRHRFLNSDHIIRLTGGSRQQLLRRLQTLFHHGYLDRPRAQIDYYHAGSQAMVYGIGNKGMKTLESEFQRRTVDWTARNRTVTRYFLEHTLAVADVMVALEMACRKRSDVELIWHHNEAFKWKVPVRNVDEILEIGVVPDRVFGLRFKNQPDKTAWFFLEADRATMPVKRHGFKQSSFYRKLIAYHETWRQKLLAASFPRFRVLTVTTTLERVENLLNATAQATQGKGAGLFLFVDKETFLTANDALAVLLRNGRGESVSLLD